MLEKFKMGKSKELKELADMISSYKQSVSAALNTVLKGDCMEHVRELRECRTERLRFEEKVGRGEKVFLDISLLGKEPEGDTMVDYKGEALTLEEVGVRTRRFDMAALKRYYRLSISNRLMVFAPYKADKETIARRCLAELGIDESEIVPQERVEKMYPDYPI
jgi:hypothetical protein